MQKFYELISSLRHDINQQLEIADILNLQGCLSERDAFLKDLKTNLPNIYETGIPSVNALLSFKAYECKNANIQFRSQICNLQDLPIEVIDITSILANLLNNAIEAQVNSSSESREKDIFISIKRTRNVLFIDCINSCFRTIKKGNDGRFISTKTSNQHGYGIENITNITRRYGGECSFEVEEKKFVVSIYIPYKKTPVDS